MRILVLLLALFIVPVACGEKDGGKVKGGEAAPTAVPPAKDKGEPAKADKKVEVPAAGKEFKPPIKPEQLPDKVWYCDMGTVHYARMDKGDGECPLCMMKLKQLGAAAGGGSHEGHGHP